MGHRVLKFAVRTRALDGKKIPSAMMVAVVASRGQEARLCGGRHAFKAPGNPGACM